MLLCIPQVLNREEVARLEQPARIEALSERYLGLKPVSLKQELRAADLPIVLAAPTATDPVRPPAAQSQVSTAKPALAAGAEAQR